MNDHLAPEPKPGVKCVLCPGLVISRTVGDMHRITAMQLARLYEVPMSECEIFDPNPIDPWTPSTVMPQRYAGLLVLAPREDGNYTLPPAPARRLRFRSTSNPQAPDRGSPGYDRVLARGCKVARDTSYYGDGDECGHEYGWACDDCPCVSEPYYKEQEIRSSRLWRFILLRKVPTGLDRLR